MKYVNRPLSFAIQQHYSLYIFRAQARLDVPTSNNPEVIRELRGALPEFSSSKDSVAWSCIRAILHVITAAIQTVSQASVLAHALSSQRDGLWLAVLSIATSGLSLSRAMSMNERFHSPKGMIQVHRRIIYAHLMPSSFLSGGWAITTRNEDYVKVEGLRKTVNKQDHRQEIVAGNMWHCLFDGKHTDLFLLFHL